MADEPAKDAAATESVKDATAKGRTGRRIPPWPLLLVVLALVAGVAWFQRPERLDGMMGNFISEALGALALVLLGTWYVFLSGYSRRARFAPLCGLVVLGAVFVALFRFEYLSSFAMPVFSPRWTPKRVVLDDVPDSPSGEAVSQVDLSVTSATDFPRFLGPDANLALDGVELARDWEAHPPREVWRQPIGAGWSAFSVVNGYAVTMEQRGDTELISCYDMKTGELLWWNATKGRHEDAMGGDGPRSTPTIHEGRVYALGALGTLHCLDGSTGEDIWQHDLVSEFGTTLEEDKSVVVWGRAGSPLIVDDLVVVPAGGPELGPCVSLIAYDRESGDEVWRGGEYQISYSSPSLATVAGTPQILSVNQEFMTGHDPETGRVLWEHEWPGMAHAFSSTSQAIGVLDDSVFVSKGYSEGAMLLRVLAADGETWTTDEVWKNRNMKTRFTNVTIHEGFVYGLDDGILECIELETGKRRWKRGRYGNGQILRVGELLLVLGESGELFLVEVNPERHVELASFPAIEGKTWNNLCFSAPYLLVRNADEAACYELPLAGN